MPTGHVSSSSEYCTSMREFQNKISGKTVDRIEISAGSTKVTCDDATKANQIASSFSRCTHSCSTESFSCQGSTWHVGFCNKGGEITVGPSGMCTCAQNRVVIRPCVNGDSWGGAGSTCSQSSMTLKVFVSF